MFVKKDALINAQECFVLRNKDKEEFLKTLSEDGIFYKEKFTNSYDSAFKFLIFEDAKKVLKMLKLKRYQIIKGI